MHCIEEYMVHFYSHSHVILGYRWDVKYTFPMVLVEVHALTLNQRNESLECVPSTVPCVTQWVAVILDFEPWLQLSQSVYGAFGKFHLYNNIEIEGCSAQLLVSSLIVYFCNLICHTLYDSARCS